ncbi:hypothetical protein E2C01_004612 [Portunus trituberculatus]|uniref:Uncharacterized protein n=1 Tax=Portunus trituberculatus TaxID=210409 RepID=A0A5B7CQ60_PORTR|nr:hypothetical protein [Portunus trituberculatus]
MDFKGHQRNHLIISPKHRQHLHLITHDMIQLTFIQDLSPQIACNKGKLRVVTVVLCLTSVVFPVEVEVDDFVFGLLHEYIEPDAEICSNHVHQPKPGNNTMATDGNLRMGSVFRGLQLQTQAKLLCTALTMSPDQGPPLSFMASSLCVNSPLS